MGESALSGLRPTGIIGVYFRDHKTRKHGVKFDRQWIIRQTLGGLQRVSVFGWMSEGVLLGDAINKAAEYKANYKWNNQHPAETPRPICKKDEDAADKAESDRLKRERQRDKVKNITFGELFTKEDGYLDAQKTNGKKSIGREEELFKYHINPVIGHFTFDEIQLIHFTRIKKNMINKKQSPRSIEYALAVVRMVWNFASRSNVTDKKNPGKTEKAPKYENKKDRFFSLEEERLYLDALAQRSPTTHDMAVMSLDTGARWSELADLQWQHVNIDAGTVRLIETKNGSDRTLHFVTARVAGMLKRRKEQEGGKYVFPASAGGPQHQVNRVSYRVIKELGLNDGMDRKHQLSFHSCRHTCASRLAMAGVPIYTIKEILGHKRIISTERYAHLMPSASREALKVLEQGTAPAQAKASQGGNLNGI